MPEVAEVCQDGKGANVSKNRPYDAYPVRCRVPGYHELSGCGLFPHFLRRPLRGVADHFPLHQGFFLLSVRLSFIHFGCLEKHLFFATARESFLLSRAPTRSARFPGAGTNHAARASGNAKPQSVPEGPARSSQDSVRFVLRDTEQHLFFATAKESSLLACAPTRSARFPVAGTN